jgi:hypothetical protein
MESLSQHAVIANPAVPVSAPKAVLPVATSQSRSFQEVNVLYLYNGSRRGVLVDQSGPQGTVDMAGSSNEPILAGAWKRGLQVRNRS